MYRTNTTDQPINLVKTTPYLPAARIPAEAIAARPQVYQPEPLYSRDQVYELMQQIARQPPAPPQPRDVWPARLLAGGAGGSMLAGVIGAVAPELVMAGHAVEMAGFGVGAALAGLALLKGRGPNISVNVTNNNTGSSSNASSRSDANAGFSVRR